MSFSVFEAVTIRASGNCLQAEDHPAGALLRHAHTSSSPAFFVGHDNRQRRSTDYTRYAYRNLFGTALVVRSLDAGATIRAFCYTLSILALNFAAIAGFSGRYPVRVLLGNGSIARIRVGLSGSRSVTANSLTAPILDAISRKQTRSK